MEDVIIKPKTVDLMKRWLCENGYTCKINVKRSKFRDATSRLLNRKCTKENSRVRLYNYIMANGGFSKGVEKYDFYKTKEWRALRVKVLLKQGKKCCLCGSTPKEGIVLHVDHIKPRSLYPKLELVESNLQVLCEDCNLGKSNLYTEDWR